MFWDRTSLWSPGGLPTHHLPTSAALVLGIQAYTTTSSSFLKSFVCVWSLTYQTQGYQCHCMNQAQHSHRTAMPQEKLENPGVPPVSFSFPKISLTYVTINDLLPNFEHCINVITAYHVFSCACYFYTISYFSCTAIIHCSLLQNIPLYLHHNLYAYLTVNKFLSHF